MKSWRWIFYEERGQSCPRVGKWYVQTKRREYAPAMKITCCLFETFLKCPTKCWLRFTSEPPSGNEYAERVYGQDESYRREETRRLHEAVPEAERVVAPTATGNFKAAKWRLAVDLEMRANRRADSLVRENRSDEEARGPGGPRSEQLLESRLHAVERIPSATRQLVPKF